MTEEFGRETKEEMSAFPNIYDPCDLDSCLVFQLSTTTSCLLTARILCFVIRDSRFPHLICPPQRAENSFLVEIPERQSPLSSIIEKSVSEKRFKNLCLRSS